MANSSCAIRNYLLVTLVSSQAIRFATFHEEDPTIHPKHNILQRILCIASWISLIPWSELPSSISWATFAA
jgi:hypothetical protein